ncbi:MAG: hypothetical protein ABF377_00955 [Akkermansiaceae bacterium]
MSTPSIPGLDKLDRRDPLPSISDLLAAQPSPDTGSKLPPLKDLMPPLTQLPQVSSVHLSQRHQERLVPIPPAGFLSDRVSQSMEEKIDFSQILESGLVPPPQTRPSAIPTIGEKELPLPFLPESASEPFQSTREKVLSPEMSYPIPSPFEPKAEDLNLPGDDSSAALPPHEPSQNEPPVTTQETEEDLIEALLPLVESSLEKALYAPQTGLHTYLEPMLRSTVRRAIAEQMQTAHHFGQISTADRLTWRMKALFSSQTFDDIVFDRTHRYQVEEVFLMRYDTFSLISYASHDPSRHANAKKIRYDLSRFMAELKDENGELRKSFTLPEKRSGLVRQGRHGFLVAVIRGRANALVRADLDYTLEQVEQRFEKQLRAEGHHFIHVVQPILESCLLIQSPAPPR